METLILKSKSHKRLKLIQTLAKELGVTSERKKISKRKPVEITLLSEKALAKDWLSKEDDKAWKDL